MSNNPIRRIRDFADAEANRFEENQGSKIRMSAGQVARYREFIQVIFERFCKLHGQWVAHCKTAQDNFTPGTRSPTSLDIEDYHTGYALTVHLHLETETFYLFAKILLDRSAHFLEFYFGQARGLPLDSHDKLAKHLDRYATQKELDVSTELRSLIHASKARISDYRDYHISHDKSPYTMRGTLLTGDGKMVMSVHKRQQQIDSEDVRDLVAFIDEYLEAILSFVAMNRCKAASS